MACAPPTVMTLLKHEDRNEMDGCDLNSLQVIGCGGAPLANSMVEKLSIVAGFLRLSCWVSENLAGFERYTGIAESWLREMKPH
ncbi:hypothetical protein ACFX2J_000485 [Malus domestica]